MNDKELNVRIIFRGTGKKTKPFSLDCMSCRKTIMSVCKCERLWYVLKPNQRGVAIKSLVSQQQIDSDEKSVTVLWVFCECKPQTNKKNTTNESPRR